MDLQTYREKLQGDTEYKRVEDQLRSRFKLADEVLRLRLEKGWSQKELARRVGTKQANISRLERGEGNPTIDFLDRVGKAFKATLDISFVRKASYNPPSPWSS